MKKLFVVKNKHGKTETQIFESKREAKILRDTLNSVHPNGGYYVSIGPDHWRNNNGSN